MIALLTDPTLDHYYGVPGWAITLPILILMGTGLWLVLGKGSETWDDPFTHEFEVCQMCKDHGFSVLLCCRDMEGGVTCALTEEDHKEVYGR